MATEKQTAYIKSLIDKMRPENMDWWNKEITGTSQEDIELGIIYHQSSQKAFVLSVIEPDRRERRKLDRSIDVDQSISLYNDHIAKLDALDLDAMSTADASDLIDQLKAVFH